MNLRTLLVIALLTTGADSLMAQRWSVSPFASYRFGGSLDNSATGDSVSIEESPGFGVELNFDPMDSGLKFALLYSHQDTETKASSGGVPEIKLDVDEIMVGAIQELYDEKFRPFVGGYVGATYFRPSGYDDELRFAFGLTAGANYYVTEHLGLRLDLRGFGTVVEDNSGFLCTNGGCVVNWNGDVMWQGEVAGSVFITF